VTSRRLTDSLPVPRESAGKVLASLARRPELESYKWSEDNARVAWTLDVPPSEASCVHLVVRRVVERVLALHDIG
jgi:hypothetical protein